MKATLKSINTFLNTCVDYLDNRILTGKFIGDSIHIFKTSGNFFYKIPKKLFFFITRSTLFAQLTDAFFYFWRLFLKIPLAKTIVSIIIDAIKILITCYSEFFIVFAFTFTSSILLLNFFQTSLVTFFIALIPLLLLDVSFVSALYYCIDRHGAGEHISIWQSLLIVFRHFTSFSFTIIVESAILL